MLATQEADQYHSFVLCTKETFTDFQPGSTQTPARGFQARTLQLVSSSYLTPEGKFEAGAPSVQLQILRFQIFTDKEIAPP